MVLLVSAAVVEVVCSLAVVDDDIQTPVDVVASPDVVAGVFEVSGGVVAVVLVVSGGWVELDVGASVQVVSRRGRGRGPLHFDKSDIVDQ